MAARNAAAKLSLRVFIGVPPIAEDASTAACGGRREGRMPCRLSLHPVGHAKSHTPGLKSSIFYRCATAENSAQNKRMRLRGILLGVAAVLLDVAVAHDADAGKSGGGRGSASAGGARSAAPGMRSSFAGSRSFAGSPQRFHNGTFPHRRFSSSFVAFGVGVG